MRNKTNLLTLITELEDDFDLVQEWVEKNRRVKKEDNRTDRRNHQRGHTPDRGLLYLIVKHRFLFSAEKGLVNNG